MRNFAKQSGEKRRWKLDPKTGLMLPDNTLTRYGEEETSPTQNEPITSTSEQSEEIVKRLERMEQNQLRALAMLQLIVQTVACVSFFSQLMQTFFGWSLFNFIAEVQKGLLETQIEAVVLFIKNYSPSLATLIGERAHWDSLQHFVRLIWRKLARHLHIS